MQFASASYGEGLAPAIWRRTTAVVPVSTMWSLGLVLLLTYVIAGSTVTAAWVPSLGDLPKVGLLGALLLAALALVKSVRWPVALATGVVFGGVVVGLIAGGTVTAAHPSDPHDLRLVGTWASRIFDGSAFGDQAFFMFATTAVMWAAGAWLAWCSLRLQSPMIGLGPGASVLAANVLNYPANQNGYVLGFLVLTLALLLWTNFIRSVGSARLARVRLTGDARWDFWESGLVAMAAVVVIGIILPPISTVDRTTQFESGIFTQWAALQAHLAHTPAPAAGGGGFGSTGFSTDVSLGGALRKSSIVVFGYTTEGSYAGPRYFRGVDEDVTANGVWSTITTPPLKARLPSDANPIYAEDYNSTALGAVDITMTEPPASNPDILFYPGRLFSINRETEVWGSDLTPGLTSPLVSVDRVTTVSPSTSAGTYRAVVEYSAATEDDLRGAGIDYPSFLPSFYSSLPFQGYRSPSVVAAIRRLALQVTAGATNNYDRVTAIEAYLRDTQNFQYTLTPPPTPVGEDPIQFFLFTSHKGYCEFFATAMGDMLRSIGIPTRLVNGFGPGTYDSASNQWVVKGEDAHTWVEVYFPNFGWITFEPTNDGTYQLIPRGTQGETLCIREQGCTNPDSVPSSTATATPKAKPPVVKDVPPGGPSGGNFPITAPSAGTLTEIVGGIVGAVLLIVAALLRYLRPRTVNSVWKRAILLCGLAGAERREGETPFELSRRLAWMFPEAKEPLRALAGGFAVAAYAPPEVAATARASVMEAWSALRPMLLRRLAQRVRPV